MPIHGQVKVSLSFHILGVPMEFKRNKVATALACLLGASGVVSLPSAFAQAVNPDVPSTRPPADIRVDVTGSNIRRVEGEGALPVQVITRQEIEQQGIQTAKSAQMVAAYTYVFNPNTINQVRAGFAHLHTTRFGPVGSQLGIPAQFGIQGIPQVAENGRASRSMP